MLELSEQIPSDSGLRPIKRGVFFNYFLRNYISPFSLLIFQEVPITIKNSPLVNELMLELSEQIPSDAGSHFLDLGSADVLEGQLKYLMETVDEFNQEAIRYNKFRDMTMKQYQDKMKYVQKRQLENSAKAARGKMSRMKYRFLWDH